MKNLLIIFTLAALLIQPFPAQKQSVPARQSDEAQELENLLDPIFAERMEKLHIPGAAVAVVKDGKLIFAKGYGLADVEKKTPVVADKTIFRIGSITKVFTANAVMQLADRWKINLSDDVNKYLKGVRVPETYPQPITFSHLLTHTSGLDEISPGRRTSNEAELIPLGAFLKTRIVRRLPPGEVIAYSTYNSALAGHIVEQITEKPFRRYVRENIFEPLAMRRTSFSNVPEEFKNDLAAGYEYSGENKYRKLPFQWFHTFPASDINSTATDMARFMMAHLAGGALPGGNRILSERMTREMHKTHFRNHPQIAGWAYGFYEGKFNNVRIVEHGGSMDDGYSALLTLVPEKNLGIFVACNTESGAFGMAGAVKNAFLNRYLPAPPKVETKSSPKAATSAADIRRFGGKYRPDIYCHTCPTGTAYFPQPFEIKANDDGTLSFQGERWRQIEPLLFELIGNSRTENTLLGFRENKNGEITYMFQDTYFVYEKVSP